MFTNIFFLNYRHFLEYKPLSGQNAVFYLQTANHGTDIFHNQIFKNQFFIAKDFSQIDNYLKKKKKHPRFWNTCSLHIQN